MKTESGIARSIDSLGRFVIPKEMRRHLQIEEGDLLEARLEEDKIVLSRYSKSCVLCSNTSDLFNFQGKQICGACLQKLKECLS